MEVFEAFVKEISEKEIVIDEFDFELWNLMIDEAIVNRNKTKTFKFKNGSEITL